MYNHYNSERKVVVEDNAPFRSMQFHSAAPVPTMQRLAPIAKAPIAKPQRRAEPSSGWTVVTLAPIPPIYCLERTHINVDDKVKNVAGRISECLRQDSVFAFYHKEENLVDAETADHIQFSVRLWEGENGGVLVEVQKVAGCGFMYCQAAKAVLRAAKGVRAPPKRRTFSIPPCVPRFSLEESESATKDGLEIAGLLFKKEQLDAHLFAIESLMHLSMATENQCFTARCILCGEFRGKLLSLIESFESSDHLDDIEKEHMSIMRRHAFSILHNCLAALERSGELVSLLREEEELKSYSVVSALVYEIAAAEDRPHEACQAAHCLRTLLAASEDIKLKADELNFVETISQARVTGACRHLALEDACTQLRTLL